MTGTTLAERSEPRGEIVDVSYDPGRDVRLVEYDSAAGKAATKFTPRRQKVMIKALKNHRPFTSAAEAADINPSTVYSWLQRGAHLEERLLNGEDLHDLELEYVEFHRKVRRARVESEFELLDVVTESAIEDGQWRAALKLLKAKHPEKYREKKPSGQSQGQQQDVTVTLNIGDESPEPQEIEDVEYEIKEEIGSEETDWDIEDDED